MSPQEPREEEAGTAMLLEGSSHRFVRRDPFSGVQIRVGVMGSAAGELSHELDAVCGRLGQAIAEEGKLIGVLSGTGGITDAMPALQASLAKTTGAEVLYASNSMELISASRTVPFRGLSVSLLPSDWKRHRQMVPSETPEAYPPTP